MLQRKTSVAAGRKAASPMDGWDARALARAPKISLARPPKMSLAPALAISLALGFTLAACGQKGPLSLTKPQAQDAASADVPKRVPTSAPNSAPTAVPFPPEPTASAPRTTRP
jgi:predicted small lipoprotein YifL